MSFLHVNGWALPIEDGSVQEQDQLIGAQERTYDGTMVKEERATKRTWKARTTPVTEMVAEAIKGMMRGDGHLWTFDSDNYSGKGLGPTTLADVVNMHTVAGDGGAIYSMDGVRIGSSRNKTGTCFGISCDGTTVNYLRSNQRHPAGSTAQWSAIDAGGGPVLSLDTTNYVSGSSSIAVAFDPDIKAVGDGIMTDASNLDASTQYTASVHAKSDVTQDYLMQFETNIGIVTSATFTLTGGRWYRLSLTGTTQVATTTGSIKLLLATTTDASQLNLDCCQMEKQSYATAWIDGPDNLSATRSVAQDMRVNPTFLRHATGFTFRAWVEQPNANPGSARIFFTIVGVSGGNSAYLYRHTDGKIYAAAGGYTSTGATLANWQNGRWITWVWRNDPETGENRCTIYDGATAVSTSTMGGTYLDFVNATYLKIGNDARGWMDDVMVLPYALPADAITALQTDYGDNWSASLTRASGPPNPPYLDVRGTFADVQDLNYFGGRTRCRGRLDQHPYLAGYSGGTFRQNLRRVSFSLEEA